MLRNLLFRNPKNHKDNDYTHLITIGTDTSSDLAYGYSNSEAQNGFVMGSISPTTIDNYEILDAYCIDYSEEYSFIAWSIMLKGVISGYSAIKLTYGSYSISIELFNTNVQTNTTEWQSWISNGDNDYTQAIGILNSFKNNILKQIPVTLKLEI